MNKVPGPSVERTNTPLDDEPGLIRRSQQGDGEAFACLYAHYVERIHRYVRFRVADAELAEDITSQVFIKVWQKLPAYQIGHASINPWLYRIAHNEVIDHYRRTRPAVSLEELNAKEMAQPDETEEKLEGRVTRERLQKALQQLTAGQRQVLTLKFLDGLSIREISRRLGKQQGAVRALKVRALQQLASSPGLQAALAL